MPGPPQSLSTAHVPILGPTLRIIASDSSNVARPSSVKLTSIFPLARRFVICLYIQAKSRQTPGKLRANCGQTAGKLRANNRRLAVSHEGW
ncbi:hypothetical protein PCANC_25697 [Puccinia coronata f. sp. avenae]|uniref:Uncharacterized protein n=1 Tax=Puccinia coronata f. sp. avenae TaxID=200324 RepID=A0A2N5RZC8_9BASI|nr:hypothetical protein PCANC_25697 [Puccinia coronata f. sp. avenae]